MVVRLSRGQGCFSVVLREPVWLEPALFAPDFARILRIPRSDSVRICRLQRGILFEGAQQTQALTITELLASHGITAVAVPDEELPLLPKPLRAAVAAIEDDGLATPSIVGAGMPQLWRWEDLALLCAGILVGKEAQAAALLDTIGEAALAEHEDRRSVAARSLERARQRVFPLRDEIARPEPQVADALKAALAGTSLPDQPVPGFGMVSTVMDLVFTRPLERIRIDNTSRLLGMSRSSSRARDLHLATAAMARVATRAKLPGAAIALAHGADAGDYVFEDMPQFEAHCRWAYFWRLRQS
jgi:hypothetical protein